MLAVFRRQNKPTVYFYAPNDYWHTPPTAPTDAFFADEFQWVILQDNQEIAKFIQIRPLTPLSVQMKLSKIAWF
ncbi:proline dipeptidase [Actinobacillus equuli]|nr:proline dipeptidase [Actinobacillus equuli]